MKNKPTKIRPPRVYRTKTGRPYIKHKGKKIYLNFGKKTNDMSTLSIIKLFLKYITKKKRSTTTRKPKSVIEKPELENREKVNMQVEKYLREKYSKINEMDKIEEKKRKEVKERAEEKKKEDEAKARQELKDAEERKRDIDRAIERERKLQAELKADRAVSQTVLRQLTASNDRIERLIEEGKNVARDVEERAIVEAIPIEEPPRRARRPRIGAAPRRERKRVEEKAERKVRDLGNIVVEDITAVEEKKRAEEARNKAEEAKNKAEEDARKAREETKKSIEDAEKAKEAKNKAEEDAEKAKEAADKSTKESRRAMAESKKSMEEAKRAKADAENSKKEAEKAREVAEKSMEEAKKAEEKSERAQEDFRRAREETEKLTAEAKRLKRNGIIDAMFDKQIKKNDNTKIVPSELIEILQSLSYDVKEVKQKHKKLNAKDTIKEFFKANPEKFYLGDSERSGWDNLITQLRVELEAHTVAEKAKLEEEKEQEKEKAKKKEKTKEEDDSKQEAKQEAKDSKDNKHSSASSYEEDILDTTNDDSGDVTIEEVTEQEGTGLRVLKDACIKIIGKLKVGDIKKFLKRTHMDAYRKKYRHKGKLLKFNYIEALMLAMMDEKIRLAVCSKLNAQGRASPSKPNGRVKKLKSRQVGGGNEPLQGLTTEQLDDLMEDEKRYLGTVASDEIKTLKPNGAKHAFIMNTDKASKPGQHWIAVYVDLKGDKTVEVYDPLGTYEPTKEFLEQIKTLVDKSNLDHYLLLKVNKIKNQSDTTDTCGCFAVKFLKERFLGNRFKFSTGFTQLKEAEIQKYKKQNGYGFDTYL